MTADGTSLKIALWATNLGVPLNGTAAWAAAVDARMAEAKAAGAALLAMPEYAAEQWLSFAPAELAPHQEIAWMAEQAPAALAAVRALPAKHDMALLAGTMPVEAGAANGGPPHRNRAHLLLPDGRVIVQDKLCLTPGERDPQAWSLSCGTELVIVDWRGLRLAVVICLDIELPALACRLAGRGLDLILVPSQTARLAGYHRVFGCARARAVELQAAVAAVGVIGAAAHARPRDGNVSGASLFVPCEEALGHRGVVDAVAAQASCEGPGPLLVAEVPLGALRALRAGAAEVWPGAWNGDHVAITEA